GLVKGAPEMSVAPPGGQDRIMIYGPNSDGTYIIEFRMADGETLAISVPAGERSAYSSISRRACLTGCSCRTLREEYSSRPRCLPGGVLPASPVRVPETPPGQPPFAMPHLGRGSRWRPAQPCCRGDD